MIVEKHFFRLLVVAALADWLISRTLARVAIFIPKSPVLITAYQGLTFIGQYASVLGALLSLLGIGLMAWHLRGKHRSIVSVVLACLALLSLVLLLPVPGGILELVSLTLVVGVTVWLGVEAWKNASGKSRKAAVLIPVAAVLAGSLYHAIQSAYSLLRLPGPPTYAQSVFNFGEVLVLLVPFCLWWIYGIQYLGKRAIQAYAWGLLAAILFTGFRLANPAMAGILAIWSTGLTLFLPAPIYAIALGVAVATVLISRAAGNPGGLALLLLACAGYAPQLSSQIFLSLIALSLVTRVWLEPEAANLALPLTVPNQEATLALSSERGRV